MALTEEEWLACEKRLPSPQAWYTDHGHKLLLIRVPLRPEFKAAFKARASVSFNPAVTGRLYWWERMPDV
jgi:hypothetical protein